MKNTHVMIIVGDWTLSDTNNLNTAVIDTETSDEYNGVKVSEILYIDSVGQINSDKENVYTDVMNQLYDDMYDETLEVFCREAGNGQHAADIICKNIAKRYDDILQVYFYKVDPDVLSYMKNKLYNINSKIYIDSFENGVIPNDSHEKNIYEIMRAYGIKSENILQDSEISLSYALAMLVDRING